MNGPNVYTKQIAVCHFMSHLRGKTFVACSKNNRVLKYVILSSVVNSGARL